MKTTNAMVLDEPKTRVPAADAVIEPAIESRPRPSTGIKDAKIYIYGKFCSESSAKISVVDHVVLFGD
jgi:phosphate-selective porin